jgi:hypothetical protein
VACNNQTPAGETRATASGVDALAVPSELQVLGGALVLPEANSLLPSTLFLELHRRVWDPMYGEANTKELSATGAGT